MAKITLSNLAHSYLPNPQKNADYALKKLNHVWEDGAAYALLGPSGCGKSTLLNIISGLLSPSEGQIFFNEQDVTQADTADRNIAQVFQFPVVYDTMTVKQNLAFPLKNRGVDAQYIETRVNEIAQMIGMQDVMNNKAQGLTADAKQKISLGRGMVREDVNAILFDEPLTVIDPHMKWELRTQLKALHQQLEHTMIYVTHDQTEALTFADKVVVMYDGKVVQIGTPKQLFEQPEHTFVGYFIGSPGMNLLPAKIEGSTALINGTAIELGADYNNPTGKVEIGIRPEFCSFSDDGSGLMVKVNRVEDVGRHKIVRTQFAGIDLNIIAPSSARIPADTCHVKFDLAAINVYVDGWRIEAQQTKRPQTKRPQTKSEVAS